MEAGNVIFEFSTASKRKFSRVVQTSADGTFHNEVQCTLRVGVQHMFALHKLETGTSRSMKIDDIKYRVDTIRNPVIRFSLDLHSISERIALSPNGKIMQTISSQDGYSVTFEASISDPQLEDEVNASSNFEAQYDRNSMSPNLSSSSSTGATRASESNAPMIPEGQAAMRLRFDEDIHEMPTTRELQMEIQQAAEEGRSLSKRVGDLSMQVHEMKLEMRDVTDNVRAVTKVLSQKDDIRNRKEPLGTAQKRRRVVLDGSVIARAYGGGVFHTAGIEIALHYYIEKDVDVVAIISENRLHAITGGQMSERTHNKERLKRLIEKGLVSVTPSQTKRSCYILKYAFDQNADIISNDRFHYVVDSQSSKTERKKLRSFLRLHRIPFTFIGNTFVPNPEFLELDSSSNSSQSIASFDTM